jgi:hypothetical protein
VAVILLIVGIVVSVIGTYGISNVGFAILVIVGLGIGAKIHQFMIRL